MKASTKVEVIQVLHVDDDTGFLKVAKQCLELHGNFVVETASSVDVVKRKMKMKAYDVIVSDYMMPGKDGLQLFKELRQKGDKIPFIIFTGKGREELAIKALNLGADGYFNKLGAPETVYGELAHGICQAVKIRKAEEALRESEERYRLLFEQSPIGIGILSLDGVVVDTNRAMRTLTRYSKVELEKINLTELCANPKQRKELIEDLRRHATVVDFLVRLKRKDGTLYNGSLTATRIRIGDKDFLQTTLQGTIEHKRTAENDKTLGKSKVLNVTSELTRDRT
ncbi:MAG: response regulator [Candidatus Bathyarchaeia archaeon]|jgi:PAS domain S-box-containing protein